MKEGDTLYIDGKGHRIHQINPSPRAGERAPPMCEVVVCNDRGQPASAHRLPKYWLTNGYGVGVITGGHQYSQRAPK